MDVCDDSDYSRRAKALHSRAVAAGVPAITTAGIYPGTSNIMAAELVRLARQGSAEGSVQQGSEPVTLRYSYYTAGSGGAGPTILATSFLLLGEEVTTIRDGSTVEEKAYSRWKTVDFGKGVGQKATYLLYHQPDPPNLVCSNLPEVASSFDVLRVPNISARFGTDPMLWNWAMEVMVAFLPKEMLQDRTQVERLVKISNPLVRLVDRVAGEKVSMRVDLECADGRKAVGIYSHKRLSKCVGRCVAAFAQVLLEGGTQPGVWFPEEEGAVAAEARGELLERSAEGAINFVMNRPPWMIETPPRHLGFGLYW
eukprot:SM000409S15240  [mRNA]  locus=s409:30605:33042:- [translate_table: standard]